MDSHTQSKSNNNKNELCMTEACNNNNTNSNLTTKRGAEVAKKIWKKELRTEIAGVAKHCCRRIQEAQDEAEAGNAENN